MTTYGKDECARVESPMIQSAIVNAPGNQPASYRIAHDERRDTGKFDYRDVLREVLSMAPIFL